MILPNYQQCPICAAKKINNGWFISSPNENWRLKYCDNQCGFYQHQFAPFRDDKITYIRWKLKDFSCSTYSDLITNRSLQVGTYFYHNIRPKQQAILIPFQIWPDFMPDWNALEELNNKLLVLRVFS